MKKRLLKPSRRPASTPFPAGTWRGPGRSLQTSAEGELEPLPGVAPMALPHDPALPERAQALWLAGDWQALVQLDGGTVANHPARAQLAAWQAAAASAKRNGSCRIG